ncbi:hypothetical protein BC830DRAFT_1082542 [Chytriomyces sp. MP71]|nr:hypothetical protein BC830DRAFT_1082542 [Chytriomyces sp. MP71]
MSVSVPDNSQSARDGAPGSGASQTSSELVPTSDAKTEPTCLPTPASVPLSLLSTLSAQSQQTQHSPHFQSPNPSIQHQLPQSTPASTFVYPQFSASLPTAPLQNWNFPGLSPSAFSPVPNSTVIFPILAPPSSSSQSANNVTKKRPGRKCTNEEPANKRIAQNRIAQKNHRERKLQHTQNLEAQVQNLTALLHQSRAEAAGLLSVGLYSGAVLLITLAHSGLGGNITKPADATPIPAPCRSTATMWARSE